MVKIVKKPKKKIIKKTTSLKKKVVVKKAKRKVTVLKRKPIAKKKAKKVDIKKKAKIKPKLKSKTKPKTKKKVLRKKKVLLLKKHSANPIISPRLYSWESKATFNPSAFISDNKIHILYRAIGDDDSSVLGYAISSDGLKIDERPTHFVYKRFHEVLKEGESIGYISGGGWSGGCEDPRLTLIDDTIYMLYTAFDGWGSVRIAMTNISLEDFKKRKWNWAKPVLISPPGEIHKNWVLFPEKINGKFAIMHSFYPKVLIEYFDDLKELDGKKFIHSNNTRPVDYTRTWDSWFRGVGPSPVKTNIGWLVLYHAMDHTNPDRYRIGALILDLKDPTKIIYRSNTPILSPEESYENEGYKWGVVYSCGAVVKGGTLFVYYGGADKFVAVAHIKLQELLDNLMTNKVTVLKK